VDVLVIKMEDQSLNNQIIIIIVGALAGLFPVLLTSVLSWLEKRSLATKQNRALDLAKGHIEFLDSWVKVQETLCSSDRFEKIKRETSEELDQLRKSLSERLAEEEKDIEEDEKNSLQRLFLAYWPHNVAGGVLHTLFYMFLGMTVLTVLGIGYDPATNQYSVELVWSDIFFITLFFILPLLFIRWLAVRTDRKAEEKMAALRKSKP
jgi:hypothetical protein